MENSRRDFVKTAFGAAFAGAIAGESLFAQKSPRRPQRPPVEKPKKTHPEKEPVEEVKKEEPPPPPIRFVKHDLPKLPYEIKELEPHIDSETLDIHYNHIHKNLVSTLNVAESQLAEARAKNDVAMIDFWSKRQIYYGGEHFLHTLYWRSMAPKGGGLPTGNLALKLTENFGSVDNFKMQFTTAAQTIEGSGWAVLALRPTDKSLMICQIGGTEQQTPLNIFPLMALDVWEHAYFLKYHNNRMDYINAWWEIVNWAYVGKYFGGLK